MTKVKTRFTKKEQATHCTQLADFLEKLPTKKYEHGFYFCETTGCALGWAAHKGIGGLTNPGFPTLGDLYPCRAADAVFGAGSYGEVFDTYRDLRKKGEPRSERLISVARLRDRAERLTKRVRVAR